MSVKSLEKDSKKNEDLKEEVIRNFVLKNYQLKGDSKEILEKRVKYFLQESIKPNEKGQVVVLDQGKLLIITPEGDIFGPS